MNAASTDSAAIAGTLAALFGTSPDEGVVSAAPAASLASFRGTRAENQDRAFVALLSPRPDRTLFVAAVLDGMGGMGGMERGADAASIAASAFIQSLYTSFDCDLPTALVMAMSEANSAVWAALHGRGGTTLTAVAITPSGQCLAVHVGDSRLYSAGPGFVLVTTDDTLNGLLGQDAGPAGSGLVQFVGLGDRMSPQSFDLSADSNDMLLLTTDGFHAAGREVLLALVSREPDATGPVLARPGDGLRLDDNATAVMIDRRRASGELAALTEGALSVTSTTGRCVLP